MSDTIEEADTKPGGTPEQKAERQAARRVGKIVLEHSYRAAHPEASGQDVRAAVADQRALQVKTGKHVLRALEKAGVTVSFTGAENG